MSEEKPDVPPDSEPVASKANPGENEDIHKNLFASVWVKVEIEEEEDDMNDAFAECEPQIEPTAEPPMKKEITPKRRSPKPRNLKCSECDYRCVKQQTLNTHMFSHSATKPFTCPHCDYSTIYGVSLKRHILVQHECKESETARKSLPTYNCSLCKYTTNFKWNLSSHLRKHELAKSTKQYQCSTCDFSTPFKYNFEKHSRKHVSESGANYCCDKCPFTTRFEGHIVRHLAQVHYEISEKASRCDYCPFATRIKWRLNKHVNRSREEKPLFCPICNYETDYRCAMRQHKLTHTETQHNNRFLDKFTEEVKRVLHNIKPTELAVEKKETCEMQSKAAETGTLTESYEETTDYEELKEKLLNDSYYTYNENPQDLTVNYSQVVETVYESNNQYQLDPSCEVESGRMRVIESTDQDRPFQCMSCSYKAKFKASVQKHYQRHHTSHVRPYKCINCDFCTKTKDAIALHNKRSKSEFLLSCKLCPFSTLFKCHYAMHEKVHMAFKCLYCDYACRKKKDIYNHFTIVHIENKLKCNLCDFKATRKDSLLVHHATHTGKKPFQCQHCTYTSVRRNLLENHILRFHLKPKEKIIADDKIESLRKPAAENIETKLELF